MSFVHQSADGPPRPPRTPRRSNVRSLRERSIMSRNWRQAPGRHDVSFVSRRVKVTYPDLVSIFNDFQGLGGTSRLRKRRPSADETRLFLRIDPNHGEQRPARTRGAAPRRRPCLARSRSRSNRRRRRRLRDRWSARCGCLPTRSRRSVRCRARRSPGSARRPRRWSPTPHPISISPSPVITSTCRFGCASASPRPIIAAPPMAPHR